jgi:thiamine pyrophosphokinase
MKIAIVLNSPEKTMRPIEGDVIIAADGGFGHCPEQGIEPDFLIGDFDSLEKAEPQGLKGGKTEIIAFNPHKNMTDGQLAATFARERFGEKDLQICFYGVLGGRIDHVLGNLAVMQSAATFAETCAFENDVTVYAMRAPCKFEGSAKEGTTLSIVPHGGSALVESSEGLEYPLKNLCLCADDTRGISNKVLGGRFSFNLTQGNAFVLLSFV